MGLEWVLVPLLQLFMLLRYIDFKSYATMIMAQIFFCMMNAGDLFFNFLFLIEKMILHRQLEQVSPPFVRGTYGAFIQIATCLGLMGSLLIGIPVKEIAGW